MLKHLYVLNEHFVGFTSLNQPAMNKWIITFSNIEKKYFETLEHKIESY